MYFAMNLMIVSGILVCSSILISVCIFILSKALFISSATVIVSAGGVIWLNPFATVLFTVCSSVTVECCAKRSQLYLSDRQLSGWVGVFSYIIVPRATQF